MFEAGAWRAGVLDNPIAMTLGLSIGCIVDGRIHAAIGIGSMGLELQVVDEASLMPTPLQIPVDAGRALCDALVQHFGGTSNSRQLRADYDAERGRVDKLTGALLDIATRRP
ncbi:hypothetical protein [Lentzea cavernae]|uniref:Uncharacterized protein n=1 Tax=Lentzea cavernae TaxID=2020703 RepID=A0ABQ3MQH8_9PSEU|nr:hypothetical protein [Lentzea cavernae]GHH57846.1 hypothetical protein GCM10017774_78230 [Lentzea cavernae]